ncbi:uncharacterized protein LOC119070743 [Bradysia coprophila]|uniref:uncharacterized protein LOC119070743 n=1 Tax=Bradysia coprophila TaxID=38358 RepID=UPI00187DC713|nr:uncharacterized protein LOC119070743 [Bradysia coprophila]
MTSDNDSMDWSKYPPDRVEGLKYFYKGPSSDEDGPCTEDELKMLCTKWDCRVDMKVDNFLYWLMKKTKERDFRGDHELFVRRMPRIECELRKKGLQKYEKYQEAYGEKNRKYMAHCADWRHNELRRLRFLKKLSTLCSTWSWDDSDDEEESASDSEIEPNNVLNKDGGEDSYNDYNSSAETVIDRFNSFIETESVVGGTEVDIENIGHEEEIGPGSDNDDIEDVNSQLFTPGQTSTQKEKDTASTNIPS